MVKVAALRRLAPCGCTWRARYVQYNAFLFSLCPLQSVSYELPEATRRPMMREDSRRESPRADKTQKMCWSTTIDVFLRQCRQPCSIVRPQVYAANDVSRQFSPRRSQNAKTA